MPVDLRKVFHPRTTYLPVQIRGVARSSFPLFHLAEVERHLLIARGPVDDRKLEREVYRCYLLFRPKREAFLQWLSGLWQPRATLLLLFLADFPV